MEVTVQRLFLLLLLLCEGFSLTSRLVCPFGHFELLCTSSGTQMRWNIDFPDGSGVDNLGDLIVITEVPEVQSFVIRDSTVLLISRTSLSPLTSLLEINNTIAALNGTRIDCTTRDGTETTAITIIGNDTPVPQANVSVIEQHYSTETVTITLEWSQGEDILYDFTVLTSPQAEVQTNGTTSTRAELQLSYNTHYNVSVVTHCGQTSTTTLQLHYVSCSVPVGLLPTATITNYSRPALVGTTAIVNCIVSNKSVVITCMDNGSWEPDPNETNLCLETSTVTPSPVTSTYMATQSSHIVASKVTTAVTSMTESSTSGSSQVYLNALIGVTISMTVFSFSIFVFGFLCGHFSHKYQLCRRSHDHPPKHTTHVSEAGADLNEQDPSELEMMDNVAYGPIKHQRRDRQQ